MGDWYKELKKLDGQQCLTLTQNRPATMCVSDGGVTIKYRSERTLLIGWALLARAYSDKVCVVGLSAEPPRVVAEILGPALVGSVAPEGVRIAPDLVTPAGKRGVLDVAARAKEMGAGAIVLACGAMSTAGIAPLIGREYGIPTIDPVVACGLFAWQALEVAAPARQQGGRISDELQADH